MKEQYCIECDEPMREVYCTQVTSWNGVRDVPLYLCDKCLTTQEV